MTKIKTNILPPVIENWIQALLDPKNPVGIRENYLYQLEQVRNQCTNAIQAYNLEKFSVPEKRRKRA